MVASLSLAQLKLVSRLYLCIDNVSKLFFTISYRFATTNSLNSHSHDEVVIWAEHVTRVTDPGVLSPSNAPDKPKQEFIINKKERITPAQVDNVDLEDGELLSSEEEAEEGNSNKKTSDERGKTGRHKRRSHAATSHSGKASMRTPSGSRGDGRSSKRRSENRRNDSRR